VVKPANADRARSDAADAAIARVLAAEQQAQQSIAQTRASVAQIAEAARAAAATEVDRAERRSRRIGAAFERDLAARLADIDAEAARLTQLHHLQAAELERLQHEVRALARALVGTQP
jgi:hypothetical protein